MIFCQPPLSEDSLKFSSLSCIQGINGNGKPRHLSWFKVEVSTCPILIPSVSEILYACLHTVSWILLQHPGRVWLVVYPFMDPSATSFYSSPILFSFMQHPLILLLQTVCRKKLPKDTELVELQQ